jgi:hypothetical protein
MRQHIFHTPVFHFVDDPLGEKSLKLTCRSFFQVNLGFKEDRKAVLNFTGKS